MTTFSGFRFLHELSIKENNIPQLIKSDLMISQKLESQYCSGINYIKGTATSGNNFLYIVEAKSAEARSHLPIEKGIIYIIEDKDLIHLDKGECVNLRMYVGRGDTHWVKVSYYDNNKVIGWIKREDLRRVNSEELEYEIYKVKSNTIVMNDDGNKIAELLGNVDRVNVLKSKERNTFNFNGNKVPVIKIYYDNNY